MPSDSFYENKIKNANISANKAIASVKANPKIAILNNSSFKFGFLEVPITKEANTTPTPTPAPASPEVANPAPICFAACNNIYIIYKKDFCKKKIRRREASKKFI